jgi:alpha-glucosidase (family GH31 glycosyl hydrolase)
MPVFIRSGGIMTTRTGDVTNDVQNPLTKVTVTVAGGRPGPFAMYEDNGTTAGLRQSATTRVSYTGAGPGHIVRIAPAAGSFTGQLPQRQWTVAFLNATAPTTVTINHQQATSTLTVTAPAQSVHHPLTISYR